MKGPYERLKYDLRRLWECPVCQRRERAPGAVASKLCLCQMQKADGKPVVMKLIEDGVQRTVPPVVLVHEPLEPLPPLVLPPDEPRERAVKPEVAANDRVTEALNPSHTIESGEAIEPDQTSLPAPEPSSPTYPAPPAPLPEPEQGEGTDAPT